MQSIDFETSTTFTASELTLVRVSAIRDVSSGSLALPRTVRYHSRLCGAASGQNTSRDYMKKRWVALFRGINVGGNNVLPMRELVNELMALKLENVRTYIQSGNVVFDSDSKNVNALSMAITERINQKYSFSPKVLIISSDELQLAMDANPFRNAASDPNSLHFYFLETRPSKPNLAALDQIKTATESYVLNGKLFFLHAPDGVGRSKLAASAEKHLGVAATARNYRTVEKLAELQLGGTP